MTLITKIFFFKFFFYKTVSTAWLELEFSMEWLELKVSTDWANFYFRARSLISIYERLNENKNDVGWPPNWPKNRRRSYFHSENEI